eukprot:26318-Pelagococcus_subviridis.AAC.1
MATAAAFPTATTRRTATVAAGAAGRVLGRTWRAREAELPSEAPAPVGDDSFICRRRFFRRRVVSVSGEARRGLHALVVR